MMSSRFIRCLLLSGAWLTIPTWAGAQTAAVPAASVCQFDVVSFSDSDKTMGRSTGTVVSQCSAVVNDKRHLLTAAHCLYDLKPTINAYRLGRVYCGKEDEHWVLGGTPSKAWHALPEITKKESYDYYTEALAAIDIAVIQTNKDIVAPPIQRPKDAEQLQKLVEAGDCTGYGFGQEQFDQGAVARKLDISVVPEQLRLELKEAHLIEDQPQVIYLGYGLKRVIRGDSGGPLICHDEAKHPFLVGLLVSIKSPINVTQDAKIVLPDGSERTTLQLYLANSLAAVLK